MKNFNFQKLIVVDPKPIFPNDKILATSVGAKNIINNNKNLKFDNFDQVSSKLTTLSVAESLKLIKTNLENLGFGGCRGGGWAFLSGLEGGAILGPHCYPRRRVSIYIYMINDSYIYRTNV